MPLYRCTVPAGTVSTEDRASLARAITTIHCEVTGAPPTFVHVFFFDQPQPVASPRYQVQGTIRAGRTPEQRQEIHDRTSEAFARIAGAPIDDIGVSTTELPASWVMEGGEVMPEPGEEEAWLARQQSGSAPAPG